VLDCGVTLLHCVTLIDCVIEFRLAWHGVGLAYSGRLALLACVYGALGRAAAAGGKGVLMFWCCMIVRDQCHIHVIRLLQDTCIVVVLLLTFGCAVLLARYMTAWNFAEALVARIVANDTMHASGCGACSAPCVAALASQAGDPVPTGRAVQVPCRAHGLFAPCTCLQSNGSAVGFLT
jgi:hypothetical protein